MQRLPQAVLISARTGRRPAAKTSGATTTNHKIVHPTGKIVNPQAFTQWL
jgi:hypothetical protein